jgi:hypothetical protein
MLGGQEMWGNKLTGFLSIKGKKGGIEKFRNGLFEGAH